MLQVTRVEVDPANGKMERVDLEDLIGGLVGDCSIEASARGCTLHLTPVPHVAIEGDSELLRRAIENVMRNAIRYAPAGTNIEVSLENGGGYAKVRVRDYGPGVPIDAFAAFVRRVLSRGFGPQSRERGLGAGIIDCAPRRGAASRHSAGVER